VKFCFLQNANGEDVVANEDMYAVLPAALPAWKSATSHRGAEAKAMLRYQYIEQLMKEGVYPAWTMGFERIPNYLQPPSEAMLTLVKQHAKSMMKCALAELASFSTSERELADQHMTVTDLMYKGQNMGGQYAKANEAHKKVVEGYKAAETKKIRAFEGRDAKRRPKDDEQLANMLVNRVSRDPDFLKMVEMQSAVAGSNQQHTERKHKKPDQASGGNISSRGRSQERGQKHAAGSLPQLAKIGLARRAVVTAEVEEPDPLIMRGEEGDREAVALAGEIIQASSSHIRDVAGDITQDIIQDIIQDSGVPGRGRGFYQQQPQPQQQYQYPSKQKKEKKEFV
jgi:hypothetical protein